MSGCVCVREIQSPLRLSRLQTHSGIWCFISIDFWPAPALFPLTDRTACLCLWLLREVKAAAVCVFCLCGSQKINRQLRECVCLPVVDRRPDLLFDATVCLSDTHMQSTVLVTYDKPVTLATFIYSFICFTTAILGWEERGQTEALNHMAVVPVLSLSEVSWQTGGALRSDQQSKSASRVSGEQRV